MLTASIFVNIQTKGVAKAYTYSVPEELSFIGVGWRVVVPFGPRRVEGFVVSTEEREEAAGLRDVIRAVDDEPWFTPRMMEAAERLAKFYLCPATHFMRLFMPGKSGVRISAHFEAVPCGAASSMSDDEERIYRLVLSGSKVSAAALKREGATDALLTRMVRKNLLRRHYDAKDRASPAYEERLSLTREPERESYRKKPAQLRLIDFLLQNPASSMKSVRSAGFSPAVTGALIKDGLISVSRERRLRDSYASLPSASRVSRPSATDDQRRAIDEMTPYIDEGRRETFLLYGVTGSGKTRVYIEAALRCRRAGRQAMVLVPEIALTGQLVSSFREAFAGDIVVIHSRLSLAERNDAFTRIRRHDAGIIIGARSALFTPAGDVGLIVIDEEQDASYKQDEAPRYHARTVAKTLADVHGAVLLLGSATPSLETYHAARRGKIRLLSMTSRIGARPLPAVECVDMREELRMGRRTVLSRAMCDMLEETRARGRQAILMLNRRGYSTFVMCRACGHVMACRHCTLPLVYHRDGRLVCHHCDVTEGVPDVCPKCGSTYIKYFGSGTEKLEKEMADLLPLSRVIRMDRDTTRGRFAHDEILSAFRGGKYDVLLGTQMVAKGHDIPHVTAVGIVSADSVLNMPDFRAAERCFALITQTAGRAGRGEEAGRVVVQCYNPDHYAVKAAIRQDYEAFYRKEISIRRELFFPPFCRLIKLTFLHEDEKTAFENASRVKEMLSHVAGRQEVLGPAPHIIANFRGVFRYVLLIKTADLDATRDFMRREGIAGREDVWTDIDPVQPV